MLVAGLGRGGNNHARVSTRILSLTRVITRFITSPFHPSRERGQNDEHADASDDTGHHRVMSYATDLHAIRRIDAMLDGMSDAAADQIIEGLQAAARAIVTDGMHAEEEWSPRHEDHAHRIYPQPGSRQIDWQRWRAGRDVALDGRAAA